MARAWKALLAALILGWCVLGVQAQPLQPVPPLTARVIDTSGTLLPAQIAALDAKLAALEHDKGSQVVVLLVPTTAPEDIAAYAQRVGDSWKIGRREVGDGLILLVAVQDRRLRIEVAKALEGAVPDIAASHIINEAITPHFRAGDFAAGIDAAWTRSPRASAANRCHRWRRPASLPGKARRWMASACSSCWCCCSSWCR